MVQSTWLRSGLWYGLVLASCAALLGCEPVYCRTSQGVTIVNLTDNTAATCARFERITSFMINGLGKRGNPELLKDYQVFQRPVFSWEDPYKRASLEDPTKVMWVSGLTWCPIKRIEVGTPAISYPHEIVHALENCAGGGGAEMHKNWEEDGIYRLIDQASGL
jgi:hypothetical protein